MQVEAALLWWRHKNKHIKCYRAREGGGRPGGEGGGGGGGGGGEETLYIGTYVPVYMNRVLPKRYKEASSYLSLDCTFRKGLLPGMSYTPEKHDHLLRYSTGWINRFFVA